MPPSPVTMDDVEQVIAWPELMPPDAELQPLGNREYGLRMAGVTDFVRVTTKPAYFEEHPESVEQWSPGSAMFKAPEGLGARRKVLPTAITTSWRPRSAL